MPSIYGDGQHRAANPAAFDKITGATFAQDRCGLIWIESAEQEDDDEWKSIWLLVQPFTDRVMATIDGPTKKQLTYVVALEGSQRRFISLDGAKKNAIAAAMQVINDEDQHSARRRKMRSEARKPRKLNA